MKISNSRLMLLIAGIIFAAVIIGMIMIRDKEVNTDVTAKTTKVGLVITGNKDDKNYNQTHYDALMNLKDELNLEIICRDNVPEDESCAAAMEDLIEKEDCRFIVGASFGYGEYIMEVAKKHPDICFIHSTGSHRLTNLTTCMGRMYQARYLSGIVAGMRTQTGKIGYVAAMSNSEVIGGINAFTQGVRSVAEDAEVIVRYSGSWVDDAAAKTAAEKLFISHPDIDVFSMHTNSLMPNYFAEDKGIWSVGYNMDNSDLFPDSYLTACEWKWDTAYRNAILSSLQGKFHGEVNWIGMETGIVGLSELTKNVAPGTKEAVEEAKKRFENRSFDVFYGPIADNKGVLRVPEGESMSDDEMRNRFDWYVEGVTVEE